MQSSNKKKIFDMMNKCFLVHFFPNILIFVAKCCQVNYWAKTNVYVLQMVVT